MELVGGSDFGRHLGPGAVITSVVTHFCLSCNRTMASLWVEIIFINIVQLLTDKVAEIWTGVDESLNVSAFVG